MSQHLAYYSPLFTYNLNPKILRTPSLNPHSFIQSFSLTISTTKKFCFVLFCFLVIFSQPRSLQSDNLIVIKTPIFSHILIDYCDQGELFVITSFSSLLNSAAVVKVQISLNKQTLSFYILLQEEKQKVVCLLTFRTLIYGTCMKKH